MEHFYFFISLILTVSFFAARKSVPTNIQHESCSLTADYLPCREHALLSKHFLDVVPAGERTFCIYIPPLISGNTKHAKKQERVWMYFRLRAGSHGSKAAKTGSTNPTRALWWWWSLANRANGFAGAPTGSQGRPYARTNSLTTPCHLLSGSLKSIV